MDIYISLFSLLINQNLVVYVEKKNLVRYGLILICLVIIILLVWNTIRFRGAAVAPMIGQISNPEILDKNCNLEKS